LAILAEKLGANAVLALDNDENCIENAAENIEINLCKHIDIQLVNELVLRHSYDTILANINKNIILDNIAKLAKALVKQGHILFSGLLVEDEKDILTAARLHGLRHQKTIERNGWIAMDFSLEG
ncbi:MAG: hypothetical protein RLZZ28_989, partial [Bacteroidota bacterium]